MSDDKIDVDGEVVGQLTDVADTMAKLLDKVMERHQDQSKDMDYFRTDLGLVRDSIRRIAKVLHEGNGERPLIARVATLEERSLSTSKAVEDIRLAMIESYRLEEERENIDTKGKWGLRVAVVSALSALAVELFRLIGM